MRERLLAGIGFLAAVALTATLTSRIGPPAAAYAAFSLPGTAADQLAVAADALEAAMAKGGVGLTFEVIQRNSVQAKPGGPLIGVRDPADPGRVVAEVDTFTVNAVVSRGSITADAFWMEMRVALDKDAADFAAAGFFARVLQQGDVIWRDDGDGWYLTDISPGTGMDPVSARCCRSCCVRPLTPAPCSPSSSTAGSCRASAASPPSTTTRASSLPTAGPSPTRPSRSATGWTRLAAWSASRRAPTTSTNRTTSTCPTP